MIARLLALLLVAFVMTALMGRSALAFLGDSASGSANVFTTDTLDLATSVAASPGGGGIEVSWTATADTYATGHRVFRSATAGGPYTQVAEITPRTTTVHADTPGAGTFYYVVRAYYESWESADSNEASATN